MRQPLEALAHTYDHLRDTLITPEGWDVFFEFAQSNDTYAVIANHWSQSGVSLLNEIVTTPVNTFTKEDVDPDLAEVFTLWDKVTAVRMPVETQHPAVRIKITKSDEFTHIDPLVGDVYLSNPRIQGGQAYYVFYPPSSSTESSWNMFGEARQKLVGPDREKPVRFPIAPTMLGILAGNTMQATNFYNGQSVATNIPHGVEADQGMYRDLVVNYLPLA